MAVVATLALAGCNRGGGSAGTGDSQVAAQVNQGEISVHQVQTLLRAQPAVAAQWGEQAADRALDVLIEQELAAQAAAKAGLDKQPQVIQSLALAQREVLARAFQDQLAEKARLPDTAAVNQYYDDHPELFGHRKVYQLEETVVRPGSADEVDALVRELPALANPEALKLHLTAKGLRSASQRVTVAAENVPMDWLPKLAKLPVGRSLAATRGGAVVVWTLLSAEEAPMLLAQAKPAIQAALVRQARQDAIQEGMKKLRDEAKIERRQSVAAAQAASVASGAGPSSASAASTASQP
jgi:EpsD family peptidyl-prolyl cis-trans isomerase